MASDKMFVRFLTVALVDPATGSRYPVVPDEKPAALEALVVEQYPPDETNGNDPLIKSAPGFCFPEQDLTAAAVESGMYTFAMTDSSGARLYGFCHRRIPVRSRRLLFPECLCILSYNPWFEMWENILENLDARRTTLENRRDSPTEEVLNFVKALYEQPIPPPSTTFRLNVKVGPDYSNILPVYYEFRRPDGTRTVLEHINYSDLFSVFDDNSLLGLFVALLGERRVLFASSSLTRLSSVVHAAVSLLNPFIWQHVFIPILPKSLIDYLLAPMPFVIGVHMSHADAVRRVADSMNEVVFVNIDTAYCNYFEEDLQLLPPDITVRLRMTARKFMAKDGGGRKGRLDHDANAFISEAFVNFLGSIFGSYYKFFENGTNKFKFEEFRLAAPRQHQAFLEMFQSSQMFEQFLVVRTELLKSGADIGFSAYVKPEKGLTRFAFTSRVATEKLRSRARNAFGGQPLSGQRNSEKMLFSAPVTKPSAPQRFATPPQPPRATRDLGGHRRAHSVPEIVSETNDGRSVFHTSASASASSSALPSAGGSKLRTTHLADDAPPTDDTDTDDLTIPPPPSTNQHPPSTNQHPSSTNQHAPASAPVSPMTSSSSADLAALMDVFDEPTSSPSPSPVPSVPLIQQPIPQPSVYRSLHTGQQAGMHTGQQAGMHTGQQQQQPVAPTSHSFFYTSSLPQHPSSFAPRPLPRPAGHSSPSLAAQQKQVSSPDLATALSNVDLSGQGLAMHRSSSSTSISSMTGLSAPVRSASASPTGQGAKQQQQQSVVGPRPGQSQAEYAAMMRRAPAPAAPAPYKQYQQQQQQQQQQMGAKSAQEARAAAAQFDPFA